MTFITFGVARAKRANIVSGKVMNAKVAVLAALAAAGVEYREKGDFRMSPVSKAVNNLIATLRVESDSRLDSVCHIIDCETEERAIEIAEALGNLPNSTTAYTDESLVALANERADYIDLAEGDGQ